MITGNNQFGVNLSISTIAIAQKLKVKFKLEQTVEKIAESILERDYVKAKKGIKEIVKINLGDESEWYDVS